LKRKRIAENDAVIGESDISEAGKFVGPFTTNHDIRGSGIVFAVIDGNRRRRRRGVYRERPSECGSLIPGIVSQSEFHVVNAVGEIGSGCICEAHVCYRRLTGSVHTVHGQFSARYVDSGYVIAVADGDEGPRFADSGVGLGERAAECGRLGIRSAPQGVSRRVYSGPGKGRRGRWSSRKQISKGENGIRYVDRTIVVAVGGVQAIEPAAGKEVKENGDRVADIDGVVEIGIASNELVCSKQAGTSQCEK